MKRYLGFVVALIIILNCGNACFVSASDAETMQNMSTEAEEVLLALDINIPENSQNQLSRAEFLKIVMDSFGKGFNLDNNALSKHIYDDVPSEHYAYNYVSAAYDMGWISVPENKCFRPDDSITITEALKILFSVVEYNKMADAVGGYPAGYISTAHKIGILSEISGDLNEPLKRETAVKLFFAFLKSNCPEFDGFYGKNYTYTVKDKTVMNVYFDVYETEAEVTANRDTALMGEGTGEDHKVLAQITADKSFIELYDENDLLYDSLGRQMRIYYKKYAGTDRKDLVYACPEYENDELTLNFKTFLEYDNDKIKYVNESGNGKIRTASLPRTASVIFNGKCAENAREVFSIINSPNDYNIENIKLIDSDANGIYDVIKVNAYKNYVADSVSLQGKGMRVKYSGEIINFEDDDIFKNCDGNDIDLMAITSGNVVSVWKSQGDEPLKRIVVSDRTVSGYSEEVENDAGIKYITVSGKRYSMGNGAVLGDNLIIGKNYLFYLDFAGNIVDCKNDAEKDVNDFFGYIDDKIYEAPGSRSAMRFKVFTLNGVLRDVILSKDVKINDIDYKNKSDDDFSARVEHIMRYTRFVHFKVTGDGKVKSIITPKLDADTDDFHMTLGVPAKYLTYKSAEKMFYGSDSSTGGAYQIPISDETIIMNVPDYTVDESERENYYRIAEINSLPNNSKSTVVGYTLEGHSINADVLVRINTGAKPISDNNYHFIVDSVRKAVNNNGEPATKIVGYQAGAPRNYTSAKENFVLSDGSPANVESGDIIMVSTDYKGDCDSVKIIYKYSAGTCVAPVNQNNFGSGIRRYSGYIYSADKDRYSVISDWTYDRNGWNGNAGFLNIYSTKNGKLLVFDSSEKSGNRIRIGSTADMKAYSNYENGSRVFVSSKYGVPFDVVIYQ